MEIVTKKDRDEWKRQTDLIDQHIKMLNTRLATSERALRERLLLRLWNVSCSPEIREHGSKELCGALVWIAGRN